MKFLTSLVLTLSGLAAVAIAQSPANDHDGAQETQTRGGYWADPSTGLMWTAKDNGKDVSWKKAVKYCRDLRLSGDSDWRLATIFELGAMYDKNANAQGLAGMHGDVETMWHVKGNLFLTGYPWSSGRGMDDRGHPSGYAWYFNFNEGLPNKEPTGFLYPFSFRRALCVRGSGK